jgi:hypothetical protein
MSALAVLILVVLLAIEALVIASLWIDVPACFGERRRRRDVVRRSAADQETQARRAAQQLSLMAWRARHEMYNLADQGRASRAGYPARRDDD